MEELFDVLNEKGIYINRVEAIKNDWRKTKSWKPGWEYII